MGFTAEQIAARQAAKAEKLRLDAAAEAARLAREQEHLALCAQLAQDYPNVPEGDALELWRIASLLTMELLQQYVDGQAQLIAKSKAPKALFTGERFVDTREGRNAMQLRLPLRQRSRSMSYRIPGLGEIETYDKGYVDVLAQMARSIQDIGQSFEVRETDVHRTRCEGREPRVMVTCTVEPLPE